MTTVRRLGLVLVAALVLSGCSLISPDAQPNVIPKDKVGLQLLSPTIPETNGARVRFITQPVYLVDTTGHLAPESRIVPAPPELAEVTQQLLYGPTPIEQSLGYTSAIPTNEIMLSAVVHNGVATINLSESLSSLSTRDQLLAIGQLVLTSSDVSTVREVIVRVDGAVQSVLAPNHHRYRVLTKSLYLGLLNS